METRLQQLRRARSDVIRSRFAFELETMRRLVGCAGCGCDLGGYSLECRTCWDRARRRSRRGDLQASAYLDERRQVAREAGAFKSAAAQRGLPRPATIGGVKWWEGRQAWLV